MDGGYDVGYISCACFWGKEPGSLIQELTRDINPSGMAVLDVGCGEGKNAIYLAGRGARVTAIDVSEHALRNATAASNGSDDITWVHADARKAPLGSRSYQIVIAYGLLHCLRDREEVSTVIRQIQSATAVGGFNVICAFNDRSQDLTAHPGFRPCLLPHEYYLSMYDEWDIALATDSDLREIHPHNGIEHTHSMTRIIAKNERLRA